MIIRLFFCSILICIFTIAEAAPVPEAEYPFIVDLQEVLGNYGDAVLEGNPTPPDAPTEGAPLCQNGTYILSGPNGGGQNVKTDQINGLDITDFQVDIEFKVSSIGSKRPIIVGTPNRFIALQVSPEGFLGALYNLSNDTWSDTVIEVDRWYAAELRFENGILQILLDGALIHTVVVGELTLAGQLSVKEFETNNRSNGSALHGCIRNLRLYNDTDLIGVEAWYPLKTNLEDFNDNYPDISLLGEVDPPSPPSAGAPLCLNGVYIQSFTNGQDIRTGFIQNLDDGEFQLNVDFEPALIEKRYPVLVGGFGAQWIAIMVDTDGTMGIKWNNGPYAWSETQVVADTWYTAQLKFVEGVVHLFLGDERILEVITGPLNAFPGSQFAANDGAASQAFHGCLRNILFLDQTSISYERQIFCDGFESVGCESAD